jgi:hypothetical protein
MVSHARQSHYWTMLLTTPWYLARADDRLKTGFPRVTLPLLILHGTGDKATKPAGSQLF